MKRAAEIANIVSGIQAVINFFPAAHTTGLPWAWWLLCASVLTAAVVNFMALRTDPTLRRIAERDASIGERDREVARLQAALRAEIANREQVIRERDRELNRPRVVPTRYGRTEDGEALYLANVGHVAGRVSISPIQLGPWTVSFSELNFIQTEARAQTTIQKPHEATTALEAAWRQEWEHIGKPAGVPFVIAYWDFDGKQKYEQHCVLERNVLARETGFTVRMVWKDEEV